MPNWVLPQGRQGTCGEYTSMSWASGFPRSNWENLLGIRISGIPAWAMVYTYTLPLIVWLNAPDNLIT